MLKELIKIANELDSRGLAKEADVIERGSSYLSEETDVRERDCFYYQKKPMLEKGIV